ncbi:MAG: DUF2905 domain-containing protein [Deltaproteobacteria bacterium]|nr:DUF2905 domain-containing protein [Candidatus Deferrimicrobium borealis]
MWTPLGKGLILIGLLIAAVGVLFLVSEKIGWIGRLPGDITIRRDNFTVHIPLATCLVISVLLSLLIWLFRK